MLREISAVTPHEWHLFAAMLAGLFGFIAVAELLRKYTNLSAGMTRKFVHILVGVIVFFVPILFISPVPAILMSVLFIALNYFSVRYAVFKGMDDPVHQTYGTVYFPVSFLILVLLFWDCYPMIISTSILILGLGDAAATIVGQSAKNPRELRLGRDRKTVQGSIAMVLVTLVVTAGCLLLYPGELPLSARFLESNISFVMVLALITAVVTGVTEALSSRGTDNLLIPAASALVLFVALDGGDSITLQLSIGFVFALVISLLSLRAGFLAPSGAAATFLMAVIIFGVGGWKWTIPMLTFFILSSFISKMKNARKVRAESMFVKSHRRDSGQVLANGGIASLFVIGNFIHAHPLWYIAYLAAIAAAMADTWSTEIGILFGKMTRNILTWEKVTPGFSGGVSAPGLFAGISGALLIGLSGIPFSESYSIVHPPVDVFIGIIALAGFAGSLIDSYTGALLQIQYRCERCNEIVEREEHCGVPTVRHRGIRWINNDWVNVFCTASASLISVLLYVLI
jgi:uncharacterized protein (TIGR00297 family)